MSLKYSCQNDVLRKYSMNLYSIKFLGKNNEKNLLHKLWKSLFSALHYFYSEISFPFEVYAYIYVLHFGFLYVLKRIYGDA